MNWKKLLAISFLFIVVAYFFSGIASAQAAPPATQEPVAQVSATDKKIAEIQAKSAAEIAKLEAEVAKLKATLEVTKLEAALKVAKAEGDAAVERLQHQGEQDRQDKEVSRDNSRDDHRPPILLVNRGYAGTISYPIY